MFIDDHCLPTNSNYIDNLVAYGHYIRFNKYRDNIKPVGNNEISIEVQDGTKMKSSHTGYLPFDQYPTGSRKVHIFKNTKIKMLLSNGQLCDAGVTETFRKST